MPPPSARQVYGSYELVEPVGSGAFGQVWKARRSDGSQVALKFIPKTALLGDGLEAITNLSHPHVLRVYERLHDEDHCILVMELADESLQGRLRQCLSAGNPGIPRDELLAYVRQAAEGIDYLNDHSVVHCDIKPENLLLVGNEVKVADFDFARLVQHTITTRGSAGMTLDYAAPELLSGEINQRASDQYSLAATYHHLRTGRHLFPELTNPGQVVLAHVQRPPELAALPPEERPAVAKALSKNAADRWRSCREFVAALTRAVRAAEPAPEGDTMSEPSSLHKTVQGAVREAIEEWRRGGVEEREKQRRLRTAISQAAAVVPALLLALVGIGWLFGAVKLTGGQDNGARDDLRAVSDKLDALQKGLDRIDDRLTKLHDRLEGGREEMVQYRLHLRLAEQALAAGRPGQAHDWLDSSGPPRLRGWEWHFLKRLSAGEHPATVSFPSGVLSVAVSPDGSRLAVGLVDGTMRVHGPKWSDTPESAPVPDKNDDVPVLDFINIRKGLPGAKGITSLSWSLDGKRLASADLDGTIRLWDAVTGTLVGKPHSADTRSERPTTWTAIVALSPDGATLAYNGERPPLKAGERFPVMLKSVDRDKHIGTLQGHGGEVTCLQFSRDGKRIFTGSGDKTVRAWDPATCEQLFALEGHTEEVTSLALSADGHYLVTGSGDRTVRLWDVSTRKQLLIMRGHSLPVTSVAFIEAPHPRIVSASYDHTVKIWDAHSGEEMLTLTKYLQEVRCVAASTDGFWIISGHALSRTGGNSGQVRLWDSSTTPLRLTFLREDRMQRVSSVCFSPDGRHLATASSDRTVSELDVAVGIKERTAHRNAKSVRCVCFSPDGMNLAIAEDEEVRIGSGAVPGIGLLDTEDRFATEVVLRGHDSDVKDVCFSPDGKRLATASKDQTVRVWDADNGREVRKLKGHTGFVLSVRFSPDGRRLATASSDRTVRVWDINKEQEPITLYGHTSAVNSVCFSPDGKRLASASSDQTVRVWDIDKGQEVGILKGHTAAVLSVCFSPEGERLASAGRDKTIRLWDAAAGKEQIVLKGHTADVNTIAFSPDGKRLVSASDDGTVKVWDVATEP